MEGMQREINSQNKEIESLTSANASWKEQNALLQSANESKQKALDAQKRESEDFIRVLFREQKELNENLTEKATKLEEKQQDFEAVSAEKDQLTEALAAAEKRWTDYME